MSVGILKYPIRKFRPYYGNLLWLPLKEMSVGVSPNLINNGDGEIGDTSFWTHGAATLVASEGTIKYAGAKSIKVYMVGAGMYGYGTLISSTVGAWNTTATKMRGITLTARGYILGPVTNNLNEVHIAVGDNTNNSGCASQNSDGIWKSVSVSRKIAPAATSVLINLQTNRATSDADEIVYGDELAVTYPQSISRDQFARIIHPEGAYNNGKGFYFDGVDDLITCESDFIDISACTIMGWIKPTGWGGGSAGRIIDNGKLGIYLNSASGLIYFTSDFAGALATANNSIQVASPIWYHVAFTRVADGTGNAYINGVLSGSANQPTGTPTAGTSNVCFGNRLAGDRAFVGNIDDLQVYNRVLSLSEINNHRVMTRGAH
jgi:hypothetical protein